MRASSIDPVVAANIREALRRSGRSAYAVSLALGHNGNWLNRIVNQRKGIPYQRLRELADELGILPGDLIDGPRGEGAFDREFRATFVPVYPAPASAGVVGGNVVAPPPSTPHCFSRARLEADGIQPYNATVYQVTGDSMEPTLADGSRILVDRGQAKPMQGCLFVIDASAQLLVKRFDQQAEAEPWWYCDNREYPPIRHDASVTVRGRVRWSMRRFDDNGN